MTLAAIEPVLRFVLAGADQPPTPAAVTFVLRTYIATGDQAARDAAERGLACGVAAAEGSDPRTRVLWLRTLAEAASCTPDANLTSTIERTLPSAIDALESSIRQSYEPGDGLVGASVSGQVRYASALLAGYDLTARLPYAMLADELMATIRRREWDEAHGWYGTDVSANCVAAAVSCRLAALHADADYRARAIVAPGATYQNDAQRLLESVSDGWQHDPARAAEYGLALLEWFALEAILQ